MYVQCLHMPMTVSETEGMKVKTTEVVFRIIEAIQKRNGATLSELTEDVDRAKSTVCDHLSTLEEMEYLVKEGNEYHLSLRFLSHGIHAKDRTKLSGAIRPPLKQLADKTGEVAWVMVKEYDRAVILDMAVGEQAVRTLDRVGMRTHMHYHAAGKAILAHLPPKDVKNIIDRCGLPARTEHTITDPEELNAELEDIRERGYAIMDNEALQGLRSVAAPIKVQDSVLGAVSVAAPSKRLSSNKLHREISNQVLGAANVIELKMTYPR